MTYRNGFPDVIKILTKVIGNMNKLPPGSELDMNNVTLRISLDVTGLVGFAKDYQTCGTFMDVGTDELFDIIKASESPQCPLQLTRHIWLQLVGLAQKFLAAVAVAASTGSVFLVA